MIYTNGIYLYLDCSFAILENYKTEECFKMKLRTCFTLETFSFLYFLFLESIILIFLLV